MCFFLTLRTTWIYPYYDIAFPESYTDLWCGFSNEEVLTIKSALSGSLLVGLARGIGEKYQNFTGTFPSVVSSISPTSADECRQIRFTHTTYLHDSVLVAATALDNVVKLKAQEANIPLKDVQVLQSDFNLTVNQLHQTVVPNGITGRLSFTSTGKRQGSSFQIRNFVPVRNSNFSVDTAVVENPWVLQTRGLLQEQDDQSVVILFYTADGEESNVSTIIFSDGTSNIPLDYPFRLFIRG